MAKEGEYLPKDTPAAAEKSTRTFDPAKNATLEGRLPEKVATTTQEASQAAPKTVGRGIMSTPNFQTVGEPYSNIKPDPNFTLQGGPYTKSYSKEVATVKPEPTFTEKMAQGAKYTPPPKPEPTMGERMAGSAKYVPPKVDPYTGEVVKEGVSIGARAAEAGKGIISGFKGAAKSLLSPLASAAPVLNVLGAQQANEAALGRNVGRIATGQESSTGTIAQEAALQFMRDPTMAMKALQTAAGVREATLPGISESTPAKPATPSTGQPLSTPATFITGGAVDQAAPGAQKPQPKQFETSRVPESQTAVSTEPKAPSFTREQVEGMAEKGQAISRGAGGNFRYVQGPNGQVVKQNTDTGEVVPMSVQGITGNVLKPGEESPLAREARTRKETAFRDALVRQAFQPIDANTNVADVGTIKRNRLAAQQLLEQLDRSQQAGAQLGLEEKKLASTERATAATQEQNRLAKEAEQQYKKERLGLDERKTIAAEEAARNKPTRETYKGATLQGTPESIAQQKADIDRDAFSKSWSKENPQGMMESDKLYKARQVLAANTKYPMYNKDTNTPMKLRMDTEGNLYTQGQNGEAIPYM